MNTQDSTNPKYPTHTVYFLKDKEGSEKSEWIKTGVAWEHGDKDGLQLSLSILGQQTTLVVRKYKPKG